MELTAEQVSSAEKLEAETKKRQRARDREPPVRYGFEASQGESAEGYGEATGCRLIDLDMFNEYVTRLLPCPECNATQLFCRAEDEHRAGLGGTLGFWCAACERVTHSMPLSPDLPKEKQSKPGPSLAAANVRLVLGAAQIGAGETQMAQLLGTLDMPVVRGTTWATAEDRVTPGVSAAAAVSRRCAREEEKLASFDRGTPLDPDGRVPITVEYDMCWAKRSSGKAYNSLEGSGSALGAVTGKVLLSRVMTKDCDRCRKGLCGSVHGHGPSVEVQNDFSPTWRSK